MTNDNLQTPLYIWNSLGPFNLDPCAGQYTVIGGTNTMGYFVGNIRPMQLGENSRKGAKVLSYDWQTGYATVTQRIPDGGDNPF